MDILNQVVLPTTSVAIPVLTIFVVAWVAWQRATRAQRKCDQIATQLSAFRHEFVDMTQPSVLFSGSAFDQKLMACLRPLLRAELDRYSLSVVGKSSTEQESGTTNRPHGGQLVDAPSPPVRRPTPSQLCAVREAITESLKLGGGVHDPDGYLEIEIGDVLNRLSEKMPLEPCLQAIRQLNGCFEHSRNPVLRQKNFLRLRRLRSLSGESDVRVGIRLEAVSPFLNESLKG